MNLDESFLAGIPAIEIRALFAQAAVRAGVIRRGSPINQMQVDSTTEIVTLCTRPIDRYQNLKCVADTTAGVIKGHLFELLKTCN